MNENINTEYPTFNGLNRQAMIWGVPLMPLAVCGFVLMMLTMIAMPFLANGKALLLLGLLIPIFFGLKSISANDDQAIKIYQEEIKWFLRRKNASFFGGTLTIVSTKYGRQQSDFQRFLAQYSEQATSPCRISAADLPTRY